MPKLVALVRVKDGILFVREWLDVMGKLADEIVAVDNGSTDGTLEILRTNPKVVEIAQTQGFDEGRDKILVYEMARKRNPDWCIWLDIDEIFEKRFTREVIDQLMNTKKITKYLFRRFDFIDDYQHFIFYFRSFAHCFGFSRTMWKEQSTGFFNNVYIHNGDIQGITGKARRLNYRLKHYGYVDADYTKRKTNTYIAVDPGRKNLYLKHFVRPPSAKLNWYEYDEKPKLVEAQLFFYNTVYHTLRITYKILKQFGIKPR